jgi:hypothetical protein
MGEGRGLGALCRDGQPTSSQPKSKRPQDGHENHGRRQCQCPFVGAVGLKFFVNRYTAGPIRT